MGGFLAWLRSGDGPQVVSIGPRPDRFAESTISTRLRAVTSCYRFHELNGVALGGDLVRVVHGGRAAYQPMLEHAARKKGGQRPVIRVRASGHLPPPVLSPGQIEAICEVCARFDAASGQWTGRVGTGCCGRFLPRPACAWARRWGCSTATGIPAAATPRSSR